MSLCPNSEVSDACVRGSYAAVAPAVLVLVLLAPRIPLPIPKRLRAALTPFLPLEEAEALVWETEDVREPASAPLWTTLVLSGAGLAECLVWLATGAFALATGRPSWLAAQRFLVAGTWLYAVLRRPTATAPLDLFALYIAHFFGGLLQLGGYIFEHTRGAPLTGTWTLIALSCNLVVVVVLLAIVVEMPLAVPLRAFKTSEIGRSVSPEDYSSLWDWITFSWIYSFLKRGRDATLNEVDVWSLSPSFRSRPLFAKFSALPQGSLLARLWAANSFDIILAFLLTLLSVVFNYAGPFFLRIILETFEAGREKQIAYVYAFLMFCASVAKSQCDVQHIWLGRRAATRIRSELMATIYDKSLKRVDLSGAVNVKNTDDAKSGADVGKIANLFSGDASRVSAQVLNLYLFYGAPLEIIVGGVMLYQLLGLSAFTGFIVILLGSPLSGALTRNNERIQKGMLQARDARMRVLTEMIGAIKFIKFSAFEQRWMGKIFAARDVEMGWLILGRINGIGFLGLWNITPVLISVVSFCTYVMLGNALTVSKAFTAIALFAMIRQPLNGIPSLIVQISQTKLSIDRIGAYLAEPEVSEQSSTLKKKPSNPRREGDSRLGFENASFRWNTVDEEDDKNEDSTDHRFELRDLSVVFPEGKLSVVTGPTASGKTALLMALLGEMTPLPGGRIIMAKNPSSVDERGNIHSFSYAAQSPWLRHQSIKDNILFGYPYDEERYNEVVDCCALRPDFELFEDGDETEIGEKGVSLSGGTKARVALARAVYAKTKYVLLDDPLSAVDSHTALTLYQRCLAGPILAHRTVVLVTHHVKLVLPETHYLVRMVDGRVEAQGTVAHLRAQGKLQDIAEEAAMELQKDAKTGTSADEVEKAAAMVLENGEGVAVPRKAPRKFIEDEHREVGKVKWRVYGSYLRAMSYGIWGFLVVAVVVLQLLSVGEKFWIKIWGGAYKEATHWPDASKHPLFYVGIYAVIGLLNVLVTVISSAVQMTGAYRAGQKLFKALVVTVMRAPFRFHDTTPQGRMLNRFGQDIRTVDLSVATSLQRVNSYVGGFVAAILTVTVVFPTFLFPAAVLGYLSYDMAITYLNTGRDLRRMESNSLSPIFSDFAEVLQGIVTIRGTLHSRVDASTSLWYTFWMTNVWLQLNFEFLGSIAVFCTALFSIHYLVDDAGLAGLAISSALNFTTSVYWTCYYWTQLELDLNSVERVVEYLDLPQEPPAIIESSRPPAYWPSSAANDSLLVAENLTIKYAPDLPSVVHDVSFSLKAGERVGLLGRTGSGKSTIAMSILRFTDPSSGRIIIDGIDITTIGTEDLRSRLTFIPQDATLFSGTLRENLDPFDEHDDAACLEVLYRVQMMSRGTSPDASRPESRSEPTVADSQSEIKTVISLDTQITAGGQNLSNGERQLVAMARALLRKSAIVILDEATSSVDFETDEKIQTTIREEFTGSLLLTIAHRLKSVADYDRLLVLDKGKVVEFDTPYALIQKEDGVFRGMCLKSGYFEELEAMAKANYQ
ncbi:ABC bile acid [Mycena chlorophos]|uniref:ABC bile acid n=1 Tax=Mycena chlorophos TaxID=658473 RepID=A0A8H6TNZ3_MYCCL|nr:ABC bile acid [Mycena chlorophos]